MPKKLSDQQRAAYEAQGFVFPVPVVSAEAAAEHRRLLEAAERTHGPMHYKVKPYLVFTPAAALGRNPALLDAVEDIIGPDILMWDCAYIIKKPDGKGFVSWHQDLTYWGLDRDDLVTAWVALTPATPESGCMKMAPGSHRAGRMAHTDTHAEDNILHRGQEVRGADLSRAVDVVLAPGQASLHHGWVLHGSGPNTSGDRRIGLSFQYAATSMRQTVDEGESATLVRGEDRYGHFAPEPACERDFAPEAVAFQSEIERRKHQVYDDA